MTFSQSALSVSESDSAPPDVCVQLLGTLERSVSVSIQVMQESATLQDFTIRDTTFTFDAESPNPQCFQLGVSEDGLLEDDELFSMLLSSPDDVVDIGIGTLEVTILDSSELVTGFVSPTDSVTEGGLFMACVEIVSGELAQLFALPLSVQPTDGQGKSGTDTEFFIRRENGMHKQCTYFLLPFLLYMNIAITKNVLKVLFRVGGEPSSGGISPPPLCINPCKYEMHGTMVHYLHALNTST